MLTRSVASARNAPITLRMARAGATPESPSADEEQMTEEEAAEIQRQALLDALGRIALDTLDEAKTHRANLGIEMDWQEDDDYYDAKDRANPEGETNVGKPVSPEGGSITSGTDTRRPGRSTVFVPITRPYVDAAHAKVSDMLLPNDDAPWSLKATPVKDARPGSAPGGGLNPIAQAMANPQPTGPGFAKGAAPQPIPVGTTSNNKTEEELAAEEASKIIEDWLIECQWHAEVRKMLENSARIGTGVLKGPIAEFKKFQRNVMGPDGSITREVYQKAVPVSKCVRVQNCFPDPAGGENIHNGSYHWELGTISRRKIRQLLDDPSYIPGAIERVLREGPGKIFEDQVPEDEQEAVRIGAVYPYWIGYMDLERKHLIAAGVPEEDFADIPDDELFVVPAMLEMINDTVVKAAINPLMNGAFPYDYFPWQRRVGMPYGRGVARQIRTAQRMLNASVRSMMDNAGLTSGPIMGVRRGWVEPASGSWTLTPRAVFLINDKAPPNAKMEDCISFTNVQSNVNELEFLVRQALKFAEDSTGLPLLMQGQQGNAPDTVGGMTILNNNGSTVLRRLARNFDDYVTEPHLRRYHEWLQMDPEVPMSAKRDFQVDARGSTALVDRHLENQSLNQLAPILMQARAVDPDKLAAVLSKANRIDWKSIARSDEELEQIKSQPPAPPPQVLVAQVREEGATSRHQSELEVRERIAADDRASRQEEYLGKLAAQLQISTDALKAAMAQTAQKLNVQVALSDTARAHEMLKPPSEPAGRAKTGESFQA